MSASLLAYQPFHQELDEMIAYLKRLLDALDNMEPLPDVPTDMKGPKGRPRKRGGVGGKTIMVPGSGGMGPIDNYNPIQQGQGGGMGYDPGDSGGSDFSLPDDNSGGGGGGGW